MVMTGTAAFPPQVGIGYEAFWLRDYEYTLEGSIASYSDKELTDWRISRFPEDFMFQLTKAEKLEVVTNCDHLRQLKFSHVNPHVFTEHGAIMAASVLNSPKAVEVSVFVVRAFVQLREVLAGHKELAHKIAQLERKMGDHDDQILVPVEAIKQLMDPKPPKIRQIGFNPE